jgi:hypothetical protein
MKKIVYMFLGFFLGFSFVSMAQSDTISGWDFSDTTNVSMNANFGLSGNLGYDIRPEDTTGGVRTAYYVAAGNDFAGAAEGWDNGADNKFWSVKFKAAGYESLKLYSVQSSDAANPGPKYWKVQVRKSGDAWTDVPGSNVTVGTDWTTGVLQAMPLPSVLNNPGSTSCYIRWIMDSNEATDGSPVTANGVSLIDDILITGMAITGIETVLFDSRITLFPNPAVNSVSLHSVMPISGVQIIDAAGISVIQKDELHTTSIELDTRGLAAGLYVVLIRYSDSDVVISKKLLIQQ